MVAVSSSGWDSPVMQTFDSLLPSKCFTSLLKNYSKNMGVLTIMHECTISGNRSPISFIIDSIRGLSCLFEIAFSVIPFRSMTILIQSTTLTLQDVWHTSNFSLQVCSNSLTKYLTRISGMTQSVNYCSLSWPIWKYNTGRPSLSVS